MSEGRTPFDLLGFDDATGKPVHTELRKAWERGGVFLCDELDAGNANVLATLNGLLSQPVAAFPAFAEIWKERRGSQLVRAKDNDYRLAKICGFEIPGKQTFGDTTLPALTTDDIEAFRDSRRAAGLSPVTVNHDLKLLRKMLNWGIRKGYLERSPFKIGTEAAISLDREIPRNWRFDSDDDEQRLLDAANPHLGPSSRHSWTLHVDWEKSCHSSGAT